MAESQSSFLNRIPESLRRTLYLALVLTAGYLVYIRIFDPLIRERAFLDLQVAALEPQVAQLETRIRSQTPINPDERADWARTQAQIEERIPPDYRLAELLEQISILAKRADLPDVLISTSEKVGMEHPSETERMNQLPSSGSQAQEGSTAQGRVLLGPAGQEAPIRRAPITDIIKAGYYPITITFHGSFQNQGRFIADLAGLSQLVEFESLEIVREYPETAFRLILRAYHAGKVNRV
jgi:hypothetical protein